MSSLIRARAYFNARKLNPNQFIVGHLTDETARVYARDLFLIGYVEESEILLGNDKSRYTAIVNKASGEAREVFFDLPTEPGIETSADGRGREQTTQVPN